MSSLEFSNVDARPDSPSPLEPLVARMRTRESSVWGKIQGAAHRCLTRLERNRLVQTYAALVRRSRTTLGLRSGPAIDLDSVFFVSLIIHLLFLLLLSWMTLASRPEARLAPLRVRFIDLGERQQPTPAARSKRANPKRQRSARKPPTPKPAPALPAPRALAALPQEDRTRPESAEALIRLPTRQSESMIVRGPSVKDSADPAADPVEPVAQLPTRSPTADQPAQIRPEPAAVSAEAVFEQDQLKPLEELFRGEIPPASQGSPSALSSPDFEPYLEMIKRRVQSVWQYPDGVFGTHRINLIFVLDRGGKLVRAEVLDSTDAKLDSGALRAIRRASPFPPIPESLKELAGWPLRIRFTIDFGVRVAK